MKVKTTLYDNNKPVFTCYVSDDIDAILYCGNIFIFNSTVTGFENRESFNKFVKVKSFKLKRR